MQGLDAMNEDDPDGAELSEEPGGLDLSFLLLFGVVVLLITGLWISNYPQWAWFGLLSKLMSIAVGAWFAVFGCLLAFNPRAVRWIANLTGNKRTLGIVYLCMSAGYLFFGFFRLLN
jgi:membrane associated rhomboid family serine protease